MLSLYRYLRYLLGGLGIVAGVITVMAATAGADGSEPPPGPPAWANQDGSIDPNARIPIAGPDGKMLLDKNGNPVTVAAKDLLGPSTPDEDPASITQTSGKRTFETVRGPDGREYQVEYVEVDPSQVRGPGQLGP